MKRVLFCILLVAGCAETQTTGTIHGGALCGISNPRWPSASRDFNRQITLEAIAGISEAAKADREKLKAGVRNEVGGAADELYARQPSDSAFVSSGVAELATRLRQLDCAVRSNHVDPARADASYSNILAELAAERGTLEPVASSRK